MLVITIKEVPVEVHNSVRKVERYYILLRYAYKVIRDEIQSTTNKVEKELILQMAIKAMNDSVGLNRLIPTLLVFRVYPRMTNLDTLSLLITKRAEVIREAMKEVRRLYIKRQVADALTIRNGLNIKTILDVPIYSDI